MLGLVILAVVAAGFGWSLWRWTNASQERERLREANANHDDQRQAYLREDAANSVFTGWAVALLIVLLFAFFAFH